MDLFEAVKNSPAESVEFHMKNDDAIARWVKEVANDEKLAARISSMRDGTGVELKNELLGLLDGVIESGKHPYLRKVGEGESFKLKEDHDKVIAEIRLLEELAEAINSVPDSSIAFHIREGNDFARWIRNCVGDSLLADALEEVRGNPGEVRGLLAETIGSRISQLRGQ